MSISLRKTVSFAIIFMLLGAALALGTAPIINAQSGGVIIACVDSGQGSPRIVSSPSAYHPNETVVQRNVVVGRIPYQSHAKLLRPLLFPTFVRRFEVLQILFVERYLHSSTMGQRYIS